MPQFLADELFTGANVNLQQAIQRVEAQLAGWASNPDTFQSLLQELFLAPNATASSSLQATLRGSGLSIPLRILDGDSLNGIAGAYTSASPEGNQSIYLNAAWLETASQGQIEAVLLEELGHAIDFHLNGQSDSPGDEGEIFSARIRGLEINPISTTENDHHWIAIDGLAVAIEASVSDTTSPSGNSSLWYPLYSTGSASPFGLGNSSPGFGSVALADIDGDHDLDLFSGTTDGKILYFQNTSITTTPAFAAEKTTNPFAISSVGGGIGDSKPTLADIDGDGDLDLITGVSNGQIAIQLNTGSATNPAFGAASTNPYGITSTSGYAIPTLVDIEGDGDLDLFVGNSDGNILFFRNTGSSSAPSFAAATTNPFGISDIGDRSAPAFADVDADADLDLLIGRSDGNILFFENTAASHSSNPAYRSPVILPNADNGGDASPALVDLNGDGKLDLLVSNATSFYLNTWIGTAYLVPVTSASPNGSYGTGAVITLAVQFSETVIVNISAGTPRLQLETGNTDHYATYASGSGTNTLSFQYTVVAGDSSADLDQLSSSALTLNGGTIQDAAGNNALLTLAEPGKIGSLATTADLLIDSNAPAGALAIPGGYPPAYASPSSAPFGISNVNQNASPTFVDINGDGDLDLFIGNRNGETKYFENTSVTYVAPLTASSANGSYGIGSIITLTVQFSEAVIVNTSGGTPRLQLETGSTDRFATYASGSGSNTLSFSYTVQAGDSSADLDQLSANALTVNGGTIKDTAGNDAILTLAAPGTTGSLAANAALLIAAVDSVAPSISAVASTNSAGTYGIATLITLTVQFSEIVLVSGTPTLKLETGSTDRLASYASGSGTNTLSFTYTVQAGDISADLDQFSASALELNSGTIRDAAGNNAVLTLAAPGAAGSLAANAALVIAAVTISSPPASNGGSGNDAGDNSSPAITTVTKSVASTPTPVQEATSPTTTIAVAPIVQWAPVVSVTPTSITSTSTQESTTIAADKQFYSTISLPIAPDSTAQPEILAFQNQTFEEISKDKPLTASANAFIAQYTVPIAAGSEASTDAVSLITNLVDFTVKVPDFQSSSEAKLDSLSVSAPVEITIKLQNGVKADAYVKINPSTGEAYDFTYDPITGIGAELIGSNNDGTVDTIKLHIIDGGKGDDDGIANGLISDPGFLALSPRSDLYRFYNAATAMHFFTDSSQERDTINNSNWGYRYEGVSDQTLLTQGQAVQRFFNSKTGEHFFTPDSKEAAAIVSHPEWGYALEGEGFKVSTIAQLGMSTPVYRFLNNSNHTHFFTSDSLEKDSIISSLPVYQYEGVAWYV